MTLVEPAALGTERRQVGAAALYGRLLATAAQHALGAGPPVQARLRMADGRLEPLPLDRWLGPLDDADRAVLAGIEGPALDIGCGPGRHVAALVAEGTDALGVDLSPVAVRLARRRGADAVLGSIFDEIPRAGEWRTALLLDGNIGIGGRPGALLARTASALGPGGTALIEVDPPGSPTFRTRVRLEAPGVVSEWFAWARVSVGGLEAYAARAGLASEERLIVRGRWFVRLSRS